MKISETIWSLQVLRFVAALMVVYIHAMQSAMAVTGSSGLLPINVSAVGLAGVDIFFVISGGIIATIAPGKSPGSFARSRFLRIVPIYLICSILPLTVALLTGGFGWRDAIATFLFWPATDQMTEPVLGLAWTLCFEMLFYAAATLVLFDRRWVYALLGAFIVAFGLRSYGPAFQFTGNPLILEFLFGVAITRIGKLSFGFVALPIGVAALLIAGIYGQIPVVTSVQSLSGDGGLFRVFVMGIPAALIVYGTLNIYAKESIWTYWGGASYSLYLVHIFPTTALLLFSKLPFQLPPEIITLIGIGASLLLAWRVYERIERPLMETFRQRRQGKALMPA